MDDKFRYILRLSIVFLFTMAIFFFLMIFLLSLAKKHTLKNQVEDNVVIQQQEYATWGLIPGALQYAYTRTYRLYDFAYNVTSQASEINLNTVGTYEFNVERDFQDATWLPQKSVVAYNQTYDYTQTANSDNAADETMLTINMGAYNVWYQMVNKPRYFQAWQGLVTAYNVVNASDFITRLYAYNCLDYFFDNQEDVNTYVIPGFDSSIQTILYTDPNYGLGNINGLSQWIIATEERSPATSGQAQVINDYFTPLIGSPLSTDQLNLICGDASMLKMVYNQVSFSVIVEPSLDLNNKIDMEKIIPAQLGFSAVTNSQSINLRTVTPLLSIADLSDDVPYPPEFGAYVLDPTRGASDASNLLSDDASREIFEKDLEAQHSMLNTDATRNFFTAYETADMSTMENRFGFTTWQQVSLYRDYLDDLSDHFLMRNATYDIIALASLMDKNMNNTANYLVETLPFDVTTRVMSSMVAESGQTCADLWVASTAASPAPVDQTTADAACASYDFTDPYSLKQFLSMIWYSDTTAQADFQTQYGISAYSFYYMLQFPTNPDSIGNIQSTAMEEIYDHYGCEDMYTDGVKNCTAIDLASLQWGSLGVTNNTKESWGSFYTPNATTVAGWGDQPTWLPYGVLSVEPEYPQNTAAQEENYSYIEWSTAQVLISPDYFEYGLNGFYNWQAFLVPFFTSDQAVVSKYQAAWGQDFEMDAFVETFRTMIEARIMGYGYAYIKVSDMLEGFTSDVASKINGGNFYQGNDFSLSNHTAPIINDFSGFQSKVAYGMKTGSNGVDEIGYLRMINQVSDTNKLFELWNGTAMINTTLTDPGLSASEKELSSVSAGMQFPPAIEDDDQLRVYDPRTLKVMTYNHDESMTLGSDDLALESYVATNHGDSIGFAYNSYVYSKPYGCYNCYQIESEKRDVRIDGVMYESPTEDPQNDQLIVQPETGYTYHQIQNSTVFMIVGGNQTYDPYQKKVTPFPSLDPIYGAGIPLYDFAMELKADEDLFTQKFSYVSDSQQKIHSIVISMSVLAAFFLILGIVAFTIYKIKDPKRNVTNEEDALYNPVEDLPVDDDE